MLLTGWNTMSLRTYSGIFSRSFSFSFGMMTCFIIRAMGGEYLFLQAAYLKAPCRAG